MIICIAISMTNLFAIVIDGAAATNELITVEMARPATQWPDRLCDPHRSRYIQSHWCRIRLIPFSLYLSVHRECVRSHHEAWTVSNGFGVRYSVAQPLPGRPSPIQIFSNENIKIRLHEIAQAAADSLNIFDKSVFDID